MSNYDGKNGLDCNGDTIVAGDIVFFVEEDYGIPGKVLRADDTEMYDYGLDGDEIGLQPDILEDEGEYTIVHVPTYTVQWNDGQVGKNLLGCYLEVQKGLR